jgi:hypothetical protein
MKHSLQRENSTRFDGANYFSVLLPNRSFFAPSSTTASANRPRTAFSLVSRAARRVFLYFFSDYSKLKDLEFRREVAIRVGLGFELPSRKSVVGPNGPKIETKLVS